MLEDFGKSDWSELETDVIGGIFSPPIMNGARPAEIRSRRPPRNSELLNAVIPDDRFRYDPAILTYKSTIARLLRGNHLFSTLITLRDAGTTFDLHQVSRRGFDWLAMRFQSVDPPGLRLVIVNNEFVDRPDPSEDAGIRVVRDGIYYVAKFKYTKADRALVERSGFEFSPKVKWWFTLDPEIAANLERLVASGAGTAVHPRRPVNAAATAESGRTRGGPPTTAPVRRRQAPAWIKRRRRASRSRQLSLNLGDVRRPTIRTWK